PAQPETRAISSSYVSFPPGPSISCSSPWSEAWRTSRPATVSSVGSMSRSSAGTRSQAAARTSALLIAEEELTADPRFDPQVAPQLAAGDLGLTQQVGDRGDRLEIRGVGEDVRRPGERGRWTDHQL